ncbi:uncharacterized protein LOC121729034 [Aricia agestis]|uniref:uncharacterized protein LOC121729034 n=1 Tax=Aricia agestis TaxID=91739 RepID=UPI001C20B75A|nr:uncharacterized protein LOC121729034 [Aricia agestis]
MPILQAPTLELGSGPQTPNLISPSPSEISSASSPEPQNVQATPLFRALTIRPPDPEQPAGQEELERRLPGYRRIVIPRELTLIELLKQSSGVATDEEVLRLREVRLRVIAERVGLRRLHVLAPHLRTLDLDGSGISSLRDLGIGLVHLKTLSVNRCGLTSLDGVWGLGKLRELHAAGNRLRDLHALAALQKLHTLNLSNNPIEESNHIWTLGVCGALRRLTLVGAPIADTLNYRSSVATTLPMLAYLDDVPLHVGDEEINFDDIECEVSSASEDEDDHMHAKGNPLPTPVEPQPGTSKMDLVQDHPRQRPSTTDCGGRRPLPPPQRPRPSTAQERSTNRPTKLQILSTLMDEEWQGAGSKLTSGAPLCGNLALALRRNKSTSMESELEAIERQLEEAGRALASEIPRVPDAQEWAKFRDQTGIDIDIDFNERPKSLDPELAIQRLERIERETAGRVDRNEIPAPKSMSNPYALFTTAMNEFEVWKQVNLDTKPSSDDELFRGMSYANVEEVELIEANPQYSYVRLADGREATISNKHLAPLPQTPITVLEPQLEMETRPLSSNGNAEVDEVRMEADSSHQNTEDFDSDSPRQDEEMNIKRFILANILTVVFSSVFFLLSLIRNLIKSPFKNPFHVSEKEPPSRLQEPKYGTHKYIKANNVKVHYVESGDPSKPLVLFIHGFPELWYSWRHQIVHFNKYYRCISIDMRGYGESDKPKGLSSYKVEVLVEDIRDFIRQLGVKKCTIVAHDWGGLVTSRFRDTHPEVCDAVIIFASASIEAWFDRIWNSSQQFWMSLYVFMFRAPWVPEAILRMGDLRFFKDVMMTRANKGTELEDVNCLRYYYSKKDAFTPPLNYYRANFNYGLPEVWHDDNVPFLVAAAADDPALSLSLHGAMKRSYRHIEFTVVDDCGHFVQQENPDKVNDIIREFLNKHINLIIKYLPIYSASQSSDSEMSGRVYKPHQTKMANYATIAKRFIVANCITTVRTVLALVYIAVSYLKNPFKSPWDAKLNLIPPARLSDPKYGTHKYIKANGIKLHYVENGDPSKPLMLFLHGFPEFWYSWRHQLVHFSKDYRCVALDMRGYGDSERPEGVSSYKLDILIEDIRDFIRQLGVEKCILVSHDWGGLIACRFRDTHPGVTTALIMLASSSMEAFNYQIWNSEDQRQKSGYVFGFRCPYVPELVLQMNNLEIFDATMRADGIDKEDIECFKYWFGKNLAFTPPINYYRANFLYDCEQKYHDENVPFLIALAENDKYLNPELLDVMKKSYKTIETQIMKGCRHFVQQENPDVANKIMTEFLKKHNLT